MLLPEISLTPQIAGRFRAVFGDIVAIWHSKLKAKQRSWTWGKICMGDFKIVIGARSGIFTPLKNVGLIIVDEVHNIRITDESLDNKKVAQTLIKLAEQWESTKHKTD